MADAQGLGSLAGWSSACEDRRRSIQVVGGGLGGNVLPEPMVRLHFSTPAEIVERVELPVFATGIRAGFPSPADDFLECRLDLNDLVQHREATFFARVEGESLSGLGIHHGDLLMIDRALQAVVGDIIVAVLNNEFTVKILGQGFLLPANAEFAPIPICPEQGVEVWGVVIHVIKDVRRRRSR